MEMISAANARDVLERSPTDDRTNAARSLHATKAAAKAAATMRMNRSVFNKLAMTG